MQISGDTLDDIMNELLRKLLRAPKRQPTKGASYEIIGALLSLSNPRARFSRTESRSTLFSCLGELLWYLSGSNELKHIEYYIKKYRNFSDDGITLNGAYGRRLFYPIRASQFDTVVDILRTKSDSRQAVLQIFEASDLKKGSKDVPCTCAIQFFKRGDLLHMMTHMRSNDAFVGLPHDVFAFTMIQEIMARIISCELGWYHHSVGSLHLYETDKHRAEEYIGEGYQATIPMPSMPLGDPRPAISWLLDVERRIRNGSREPIEAGTVNAYWIDLARILRIKALVNDGDHAQIVSEVKSMSSSFYDSFILAHEERLRPE